MKKSRNSLYGVATIAALISAIPLLPVIVYGHSNLHFISAPEETREEGTEEAARVYKAVAKENKTVHTFRRAQQEPCDSCMLENQDPSLPPDFKKNAVQDSLNSQE